MKHKNKILSLITLLLVVSLLSACSGEYVPYDYSLDKYIELCEYKGVGYDFIGVEVSADALDAAVSEDLKANGYGDPKEIMSGTVKEGDILTLSYTGIIDGAQDHNLTANDVRMEIGAGTFLDEFEQGLIGKKIGQKFSLTVPFPSDYIKVAYAGKTAEFTVSIHKAERNDYPELTDPIVVDISDAVNVSNYLELKRKELKEALTVEADKKAEDQVWEKVLTESKVIAYPEKAIKYLFDLTVDEFNTKAENESKDLKEYLADMDLTVDEFTQYATLHAQTICKEEMVVNAIARAEKITVSDKEVKQLAQNYVDTYGYKSINELYKDHSKAMIEQTILFQKVKDFLLASAKQLS